MPKTLHEFLHEHRAHVASHALTTRRAALTFGERHMSCGWCPEERRLWRKLGYRDGLRMFATPTSDNLRGWIAHYERRGRLANGSYELGVRDALVDRLAALETPE